jgi:hypothetical protein
VTLTRAETAVFIMPIDIIISILHLPMIGQRVTPKELLHLAIASGDSVVRLLTAFSALVIGMLMQFTGVGLLGWGGMIICFILTFGALVILGRLSTGRLTPVQS